MTEHRIISGANGTNMTTTLALITVPQIVSAGDLALIGRNFSTAVTVRYTLNPRLTVLRTTDGLASFTDDSVHAQDGLSATDVELDAQPINPTGFLYLGASRQFRGVQADMDGSEVNSVSATLAGDYWDGSAWSDVSITDGTASGGAPWAQDGNITWTVPSDWAATNLFDSSAALPSNYVGNRVNELILARDFFWVRLHHGTAALTNPTSVNQIRSLNASTAYSEIVSGQAVNESITSDPIGGIGCIEALTDAGTANLIADLAAEAFYA